MIFPTVESLNRKTKEPNSIKKIIKIKDKTNVFCSRFGAEQGVKKDAGKTI